MDNTYQLITEAANSEHDWYDMNAFLFEGKLVPTDEDGNPINEQSGQ